MQPHFFSFQLQCLIGPRVLIEEEEKEEREEEGIRKKKDKIRRGSVKIFFSASERKRKPVI